MSSQTILLLFILYQLVSPIMTIKLHGSMFSTSTRRVFACLHEKGLDYEFVDIDMRRGQQKREPFLSLNPFGQVPALEDGDVKIFDSRAINKYLALTYADNGSQLISQDAKKMANVYAWSEVEAHRYDPTAQRLTFELYIKPALGMSTDYSAVRQLEAQLGTVLDVYEDRLAKSKYLGGESFSLADLHHLPTMTYLMTTRAKEVYNSRPHVKAWCADIMARPAWQKVTEMKEDKQSSFPDLQLVLSLLVVLCVSFYTWFKS